MKNSKENFSEAKISYNKKPKIRLLIFDFFFLLFLIILDQFTKHLAVIKLKNQPAFNIINGVLEFNYLENRGAAFGMLQDQKIFFIFVALIFLGTIVYVLSRMPAKKKYNIVHILLVMIASGAMGNMLDRLRLNYVRDFIYFVLINFPIFNVADICVTIATTVLAIYILFVFKDEDFEFLSFKQKKYRELK